MRNWYTFTESIFCVKNGLRFIIRKTLSAEVCAVSTCASKVLIVPRKIARQKTILCINGVELITNVKKKKILNDVFLTMDLFFEV